MELFSGEIPQTAINIFGSKENSKNYDWL